jgi:hypothetical protein
VVVVVVMVVMVEGEEERGAMGVVVVEVEGEGERGVVPVRFSGWNLLHLFSISGYLRLNLCSVLDLFLNFTYTFCLVAENMERERNWDSVSELIDHFLCFRLSWPV